MVNDIQLNIAVAGKATSSKWKNTVTSWSAVARSVSETTRTDETVKAYFAMGKDRQGEIKDVGGFVGGRLRGGVATVRPKGKPATEVTYKPPYGWRRKGYVEGRQLVALDVDFGDLDIWMDFRLLEYAGLFYTTHKHTPASPRFRIVFPLDREVTPEEYEAIARMVASWLDIEVFDDTTYQPTRLMYYPSTSKDGEYRFDVNDAPIMCADEVLAEYGDDWTDPEQWPTSTREAKVRRPGTEGVQDPTTKDGAVGAFCRAFSIEEAIAEFLSEVYEPCDDRYSFIAGSTSGGLHVYNGTLAYSWHNTDPAGSKLCNAFDLVRLHRFGDLDAGKEFEDVVKAPSFKAMVEFASGIKEVKREIVNARRSGLASDYDALDEQAITVAFNAEWISQLETEGKSAKIKNTIANVVLILNNDENLAGRLSFNEFEKREICTAALPWDKKGTRYPRPLEDHDDAQLQLYLERAYDITTEAKISKGLTVVVHDNGVHPVKQYLDACGWDGVPRLDTLFIDLFGAEDTEYTRAVTRKIFCAAVKRIYDPGCYLDYVVVLAGDEGCGKSKTLKTMGVPWYMGNMPALGNNKEALEAIQGSWIIELGELDSINRAEAETVKAFVTNTEDRFRVAYGKRQSYFPRTCVFIGTTNKTDFLKATTGNRRFWIVNFIGRGKYGGRLWWSDYLTTGDGHTPSSIVAQLWGEARQRLADGETMFLNDELEDIAHDIQVAHLEQDERAGIIGEYLNRLLPDNWQDRDPADRQYWLTDEANRGAGVAVRQEVTVIEIWTECLNNRAEFITQRDSQTIGRIMKTMPGWMPGAKAKRINYYGLQRFYGRKTL